VVAELVPLSRIHLGIVAREDPRVGLELVRRRTEEVETNHPQLLVFDEPRQQSADPVSLEALLRRAADSRKFNEQILFATSEPEASLAPMLDGLEIAYRPFTRHVLAPLERLAN
jgi:hypothetical protein